MWQRKNYLKKTEQNPSEPQSHWSNNILGSPSLSNPFWSISVRGHSHIQLATRNVQWTFTGGYLNYMYVFVCGNCLAKTYCFLPSIGQLAMPNFFLSNICLQCYQQKNKEKTWRKLIRLHIKTRPPITWLSDITRQILKCTQGKQIFSILYHINCPSKCLLK